MTKNTTPKPNGTVFKTIVREVVQEEQGKADKRLDEKLAQMEERITSNLKDTIDASFRQYRDDVLTKLDGAIKELKAIHEDDAAHQLQHDTLTDIPERVEKLDALHPQGQHPQ